MAACERCWHDAGLRQMHFGGDRVMYYEELLRERKDNPCTPRQQAGIIVDEQDGSAKTDGAIEREG